MNEGYCYDANIEAQDEVRPKHNEFGSDDKLQEVKDFKVFKSLTASKMMLFLFAFVGILYALSQISNMKHNSESDSVLSRFLSSSSSDQITATYDYTGDVQTYVVPDNVTKIAIYACGAQGGEGGALGGCLQSSFEVTAGTLFYVYVGGVGGGVFNTYSSVNSAGGYNGGGSGGTNGYYAGGGGGGASDVRTEIGVDSSRFIVAGGGGGYCSPTDYTVPGAGGASVGGSGTSSKSGYYSGAGGSQTAGGTGGSGGGGTGSFGQGGSGASSATSGGGGGGWYGGGGGGGNAYYCAGGGGSNYASTGDWSTNERGTRAGHGIVSFETNPTQAKANFQNGKVIVYIYAPIVSFFGILIIYYVFVKYKQTEANLGEKIGTQLDEGCGKIFNILGMMCAASFAIIFTSKFARKFWFRFFFGFNTVVTLIVMVVYLCALASNDLPVSWWSYFVTMLFGAASTMLLFSGNDGDESFDGPCWIYLTVALFITAMSCNIAGAAIDSENYNKLHNMKAMCINDYKSFDYWGESEYKTTVKNCWYDFYGGQSDDFSGTYAVGYTMKSGVHGYGDYYCFAIGSFIGFEAGQGNFIYNTAQWYYLMSCIFLSLLVVHTFMIGVIIYNVLKDRGKGLSKREAAQIWSLSLITHSQRHFLRSKMTR